MEASIKDPGDNDLIRQQMLGVITDAIMGEDYEFAIQIASEQTMLKPFELADWLDVRRRNTEDSGESQRWGEALNSFLSTLEGKEFPEDEARAIGEVIKRLKGGKDKDGSPDKPRNREFRGYLLPKAGSEEGETSADDWASDIFKVKLEEEELERICQLPTYKKARGIISGEIESNYTVLSLVVSEAMDIVQKDTQLAEEEKEKVLMALDHPLSLKAEKIIQDPDESGYTLPTLRVGEAQDLINRVASGNRAKERMLSSLDKHIFNIAEGIALGTDESAYTNPTLRAGQGRDLINGYVSTPERRDAMLRRLGLS